MATQLNIKDPETGALARDLARRKHTSVTAVVRDALRAEGQRQIDEANRPLTPNEQAIADSIMAIAAKTGPRFEEVWGTGRWEDDLYDEDGLPK